MANISFFVLLVVITLIAFLNVSKAQHSMHLDEQEIEKELHEAKDLIEEDLKEKEKNIKNLENEVKMLTKSDTMLTELGEAYKEGKNLEPYGKKLKKFNRRIIKKAPREEMRYGSVIQTILKDLGLNRGRD